MIAVSGALLLLGTLHAHPVATAPHAENPDQMSAEPFVSITEKNGKRIIESNGIPNHSTGQFPSRGNPNAISVQKYIFQMPLEPVEKSFFTIAKRQPIGVAVNGVVFDPGTAEFWKNDPNSGWRMEAIGGPRNLGLDQNLAHVQPSGAYHYHGIPDVLISKKDNTNQQMMLVGWAADGFPIYGLMAHADANDLQSPLKEMKPSYRLKKGQRPGGSSGPGGNYDGSFTEDFEFVQGSGDLDEANGRRGVTNEYPSGTYYYMATGAFPFLPRMFKGTPDESFSKPKTGAPRSGQGPRQNRLRQGLPVSPQHPVSPAYR